MSGTVPLVTIYEAERNLLTILLDEPFALDHLAGIDLRPADFIERSHRHIFAAIRAIRERGDAPGLELVATEMRRAGTYSDLEFGELESIAAEIVAPQQAPGLARRIKAEALERLADAHAERREYDRAADLQRQAIEVAGGGSGHGRRRFNFYTIDELARRPPQRFLIDGILVAGSLADLFGQPGSYKSFIALDWGLCIASGETWNGRAVETGPVVYVAGEGEGGLTKRIRAWRIMHPNACPEDFYVLPDMIRALDQADVDAFIRELPCQPALIVIDTLSRSLAGGNENAPDDMGKLVAALELIRRETGSAVLVLHHSDKGGNFSRGHSSFLAAVQTEIEAKVDGERGVTLRCRKQKDHDEFLPIPLVRRIVDLDDEGEESSMVLMPAAFRLEKLTDTARLVVAALEPFGAAGASPTEWWDSARDQGVAKSTFYRVKSQLLDLQIVRQNGGKYVLVPQSHASPTESHGPSSPSPTQSPLLKSGTGGQDWHREGIRDGDIYVSVRSCRHCGSRRWRRNPEGEDYCLMCGPAIVGASA